MITVNLKATHKFTKKSKEERRVDLTLVQQFDILKGIDVKREKECAQDWCGEVATLQVSLLLVLCGWKTRENSSAPLIRPKTREWRRRPPTLYKDGIIILNSQIIDKKLIENKEMSKLTKIVMSKSLFDDLDKSLSIPSHT